MKYAACDEANIDAVTGECSAIVWVDPPTFIPSLSVEGAREIGGAILLCWAVAYVWRVIGQTIVHSSNQKETDP